MITLCLKHMVRRQLPKLPSVVAAVALTLSTPSLAADDKGDFAIKGGGAQSCQGFLTAYGARNSDLALYAGWIEGYLTGLNQFTPDTYDLASWQSVDTLIGLLQAACSQSAPDRRVIEAMTDVLRLLYPGRLQAQDTMIALVHENTGMTIYESVLRSAKTRLNSLGHGAGVVDDSFTPEVARAFEAFQRARSIPVTGLPDQQTLYLLLRDE